MGSVRQHFTMAQAAARLAVSVSTLRREIRDGNIAVHWVRGQLRIDEAHLQIYLTMNSGARRGGKRKSRAEGRRAGSASCTQPRTDAVESSDALGGGLAPALSVKRGAASAKTACPSGHAALALTTPRRQRLAGAFLSGTRRELLHTARVGVSRHSTRTPARASSTDTKAHFANGHSRLLSRDTAALCGRTKSEPASTLLLPSPGVCRPTRNPGNPMPSYLEVRHVTRCEPRNGVRGDMKTRGQGATSTQTDYPAAGRRVRLRHA